MKLLTPSLGILLFLSPAFAATRPMSPDTLFLHSADPIRISLHRFSAKKALVKEEEDKISGFRLRWDGKEYHCIDKNGLPGLNSTSGEHILKTKKGECSDQVGAFMFRGEDLTDANLTGSDLGGCDLRGTDLRGANLFFTHLKEADLTSANLTGAQLFVSRLQGAKLEDAKLIGAGLSGADLSGAVLNRADLSLADMLGTKLIGASLRSALFKEADLRWSDLRRTDLRGTLLLHADVEGADLTGAVYDQKTTLPFDETEAERRGMIFTDKGGIR